MKLYDILKDFPGNQTGNGETEYFKADTTANLSDDLAAIAVKEGWAKPHQPAVIPGPKPKLQAAPDAPAELVQAEDRETKVDEPEETKPAKPFHKKGK